MPGIILSCLFSERVGASEFQEGGREWRAGREKRHLPGGAWRVPPQLLQPQLPRRPDLYAARLAPLPPHGIPLDRLAVTLLKHFYGKRGGRGLCFPLVLIRACLSPPQEMFLMAAMGPPGGGRTVISSRLQSRFNLINMTFPTVRAVQAFQVRVTWDVPRPGVNQAAAGEATQPLPALLGGGAADPLQAAWRACPAGLLASGDQGQKTPVMLLPLRTD